MEAVPLEDQSLTFDALPIDIILLILEFVRPLDIISVRLTCKLLRDVTRQHALWISALRTVCYDNNLYPEMFAVEALSLSQLEHSATTPSLFFRQVKRAAESASAAKEKMEREEDGNTPSDPAPESVTPSLRPAVVRRLDIPPSTLDGLNWAFTEDVTELRLAPGGRYLAMNHYCDMQIWDLGFWSSDTPRIIANHSFPDTGDFVLYGIWIKPDGRGLQIQTNFLCMEPPQNELAIWEIYPASENPTLELIASLTRGPLLTYECRGGSKIAISELNRVGVWDPSLNTLVTWEVPEGMTTMLVVQDRAVCLYQDHIAVYDVPHIQGRPSGALVEEAREMAPIWTTLLSYSADDYYLPASWPYTADLGSPRGDLYFALTEAVPARNYIYRVPASPRSAKEAPAIALAAVANVQGAGTERLENYLQRPVRLCEGHLALMSEPSARGVVCLQILEEPTISRQRSLQGQERSSDRPATIPTVPANPSSALVAPTPAAPHAPAGHDTSVSQASELRESWTGDEAEGMRVPTWTVLLFEADYEIVDFEFDGASGRACAITEDYTVLVLDYIESPATT
ncbi:hypothetical protein BD626DRAFT_485160 [Schizophyllum amplum]|uniref:F-box domain-containing protein n=1 Tax=Schizophyllum amplum TaxID=97359 RepID=A0A550CR50_9AGAR|nr:hypothetical protein BD626DRAFT_485160 [Auriculariopsis ampla]